MARGRWPRARRKPTDRTPRRARAARRTSVRPGGFAVTAVGYERGGSRVRRSQMSRGTGTGRLGSGIFLMIVGALMCYVVTVRREGFSIHTTDIILLFASVAAV